MPTIAELHSVDATQAAALRPLGLREPDDLLRVGAPRLARALGGQAAASQAARWVAEASLLQLRGATPALASVLASAGAHRAEDVHAMDYSKLEAALGQAHADGRLAAAVDAKTLAGLLTDSAVLANTGYVRLAVVGRNGKGIAGVKAECHGREATTREGGRCTFARMPLGRPLAVALSAPAHQSRVLRRVSAVPGHVVEVVKVRLAKAKAGAVPGRTASLMQFRGDALPKSAARATERPMGAAPLREGDVVRYVRKLRSGVAKLASIYKEWEDGSVSVPVFEADASLLPAKLKPGGFAMVVGGKLAPLPQGVGATALARRLRAARAGAPSPGGPAGKDFDKDFLRLRDARLAAEGRRRPPRPAPQGGG